MANGHDTCAGSGETWRCADNAEECFSYVVDIQAVLLASQIIRIISIAVDADMFKGGVFGQPFLGPVVRPQGSLAPCFSGTST